jgi:hypothetical protein
VEGGGSKEFRASGGFSVVFTFVGFKFLAFE